MDTILAFLAKRFKEDTMLVGPEFYQLEAFRDACEEADLKDIDKHVKTCNNEGALSRHEFKECLVKHAATKAAASAKANAGGRPKKKQRQDPDKVRLPPRQEPVHALSVEEARLFLPVGAKCAKSKWDNRWRVWFEPHGGISRSWVLGGEIPSFAKCAKWAWDCAALHGAGPCPHDWISKESYAIGV